MANMFDDAIAEAARKRILAQQQAQGLAQEEANAPTIMDRIGGAMSGSVQGAGTGASVGTVASPGYGTILGAIIGGLAGGASGALNAKKGQASGIYGPSQSDQGSATSLIGSLKGR